MRLINAHEIKPSDFPNPYPQSGCDREKHFVYQRAIYDFLTKVKKQPTIDPESLRPVAHWDDLGDGACRCSACGEDGTVWMFGDTFEYCPECGARMVNDDD